MLKRTPVYPLYEAYGAKTVDFGGWDLPVQFSGIMEEHRMTREKAALFDVSHMGEIFIQGPDSLAFLQRVVTNDVSKLEPNKAQYTFMCYENGGTIDDFLIYMLEENSYLLVVNAANIEKDVAWLKEQLQQQDKETVNILNASDAYALIAIQGPLAESILQQVTDENLADIKPFRFKQDCSIETLKETALISRTGYTGEDGFEIYIDQGDAAALFKLLLDTGGENIIPAGLGARDSLRFEAGLALYGQELSKDITPVEAGMKFAVKVNKAEDFIGKEVLQQQIEQGPTRVLAGLEMIDKGIPRTDYEVLNIEGDSIGVITTGTKSPTLNKAIGFALIDQKYTAQGTEIVIQIRKKQAKARVIPTPFIK
ncbi:MAG TPA: glycine cleavage system aminomethyltransferase GcvT [Pseudogracilibacillus sp.]|nr:glycine cleavage system aminomethyltransferase GcvT [Pseudogracilibacillus sp.]